MTVPVPRTALCGLRCRVQIPNGFKTHTQVVKTPPILARQTRHYLTKNIPFRADEPLPRRLEPLRILFCGSDHFSCASLSALHELHRSEPRLVDSIDVLVRPAKPSGRGMRRKAASPLQHLADSLGLPVHHRDTFTGWDLPLPGRVTHAKTGAVTIHPHPSSQHRHRTHHPFNLLIAVSFGLFVPPRILSTLTYGGLNLHPSLLPDLRGPAPLQWTILARRPFTGVTLQTLHPRAFDKGDILAQTPSPGIQVDPDHTTTADLLSTLAPEGARLLTEALQADLHVGPPYASVPAAPTPKLGPNDDVERHAPKVTKADLSVDWSRCLWAREHADLYQPDSHWTASDLARRYRALGAPTTPTITTTTPEVEEEQRKPGPGLWTLAVTASDPRETRVIFNDVEAIQCPPALRDAVLAVLQAKETPWPQLEKLERRGLVEIPEGMANVVWVGKDVKAEGPYLSTECRMPILVEEDGSVVIPVRMPYMFADGVAVYVFEKEDGGQRPLMDAVRVKMIKVEGSTSKPAAKALDEFMEKNLTLKELANLEYAIDRMAVKIE